MANQETNPDRKTRVGMTKTAKSNERLTRTMPVSGESSSMGGHVGKEDTRKIVGVLITFTWQPQGQLFPVREGKNFIGSDKVYSDASHQDCDIKIEQDERMSGEHALILCRGGVYEIIDQTSSNGTFLAGDMLPANQSQKLKNYSDITAGSTLFTFMKISPPEGTEQYVSQPPPRPKEEKKEQVDSEKNTRVR